MDFNLVEVARAVARVAPDRECIVHGEDRLTFADFLLETDRLARVLVARGFGCHTERDELEGWEAGQDRLALYLHNGPEYLVGMYGAYAARVAPFNVNYRYVADELQYLLADAGATAIIFHSRFAPTLAAIRSRLPALRLLLQVRDGSGEALLDGAEWFDEALDSAPPVELPTPSPDDLYILYTGGTTGMPKGVLWRQGDIYPAALGGRRISTGVEYASLDAITDNAAGGGLRVLPSAPFMHGAAHWMAINAIGNGNTIVLPEDATTFDPADCCRTIERERVNIMLLVGDSFGRPLLDEIARAGHDLSSLTLLISGGAALSAPVKHALLERLPTVSIMDGLGSSEGGQQATHVTAPGATATTGTFRPGTGMVVLSEDLTRESTPGDPGIGWLAQRGRVPLGYLGDREKSLRTFPVVDGVTYSVPGDRARLTADGLLELHGRDSATINTGGEKVFAEEVEAALAHHPAVYDVVVTGRPSERWGHEVVALVQLRNGWQIDTDELLDTCATRIARYKVPKAIILVDAVQRSPAGKADYRWARDVATADRGAPRDVSPDSQTP